MVDGLVAEWKSVDDTMSRLLGMNNGSGLPKMLRMLMRIPPPTPSLKPDPRSPYLYKRPSRVFSRLPHGAPFSKNSFASLIFVARYGLPPRSGWLSSISCRCFFRIISRVARSLSTPASQHMLLIHPASLPSL